jgi:FMN phosphatase YigB (HAD superfamily)
MNIKAVIFDLEGTLFSSKEFSEMHILRTIELLSKKMQINSESASTLLKLKRKELTTKLGYNPPLTHLVEILGISRSEFYKEIEKVDPSNYIKSDINVQKTLKLLQAKRLKLALLTNTSHLYAVKILGSLGLEENIFDCIVAGDDVRYVKPHIEPFRLVLKVLNLQPQEILMVEIGWR